MLRQDISFLRYSLSPNTRQYKDGEHNENKIHVNERSCSIGHCFNGMQYD